MCPLSLARLHPNVVISGSMMVQCCLGECWKSDIDIYCTASAAPAARSWLVEEGKMMLRGFKGGYKSLADSQDQMLHHVEAFGPMPKENHQGFEYKEGELQLLVPVSTCCFCSFFLSCFCSCLHNCFSLCSWQGCV